MHIRNLGRKNMDEVKSKLAEYREPEFAKTFQPVNKSSMDVLESLIGLEEGKAQGRKISAYARMVKDMGQTGYRVPSMTLNMEFTGNPGTAKTTVARLVAGIFHEIGLLSSYEMVEVGRADLVGKYTGSTADKVKSVFQEARGRLLFIDEAYSLVDDYKNSFGDEAINTIVQEMENNRGNTVVIFAGYPDQMRDFFSRNPGFVCCKIKTQEVAE